MLEREIAVLDSVLNADPEERGPENVEPRDFQGEFGFLARYVLRQAQREQAEPIGAIGGSWRVCEGEELKRLVVR